MFLFVKLKYFKKLGDSCHFKLKSKWAKKFKELLKSNFEASYIFMISYIIKIIVKNMKIAVYPHIKSISSIHSGAFAN